MTKQKSSIIFYNEDKTKTATINVDYDTETRHAGVQVDFTPKVHKDQNELYSNLAAILVKALAE